MDREIDAVKRAILSSGLDDWVHIVEVVDAARRAKLGDAWRDRYPDDSTADTNELGRRRDEWTARHERDALPLGITAVKELLRDGLVRIGETTADGFAAWSGTVDEIESRIDDAVESVEFPLLPSHLFWIENTPSGDEIARSEPSDPGKRALGS